MALTNEDFVAAQLEVVRPLAPKFYEREDSLGSRMLKTPGVSQSTRDLRIPLPIRPGGKFRSINFNGGDFGLGSGEVLEVAKMAPIEFGLAYEITDRVIYATDSPQKSAVNAVNRSVAMAMDEFKNHVDASLQGGGTWIFAYVDSGYAGGNTVTFTTPFYAQNLREGTTYSVYNSTQTVYRGTIDLVSLDLPNGEGTFTAGQAAAVGLVAGDVLCAEGLTATPPVGPYGLRYHHSNATSGLWLNVDRATYPQARTPTVDANQSIFTQTHVQSLIARMEMALGQDMFEGGKWAWYMHPGQLLQYMEQHITISEMTLNGGGAANGNVDIVQQRKALAKIHGIPVIQSIHASRTDVDLINFAVWLRGTYKEVGLHPIGNSTKFARVSATGAYGGGYMFYVTAAMQFGMENPRLGGHIEDLAERTDLND